MVIVKITIAICRLLKRCIMRKCFEEKKGVITNPYIGFTSFNHFRNDVLYSDCVVGQQGLAGCETEAFECYPVPEEVEEKGREQGFHPDETVAYIRILWKHFEPKQGEYDYAFIQDILDKAKSKGQTVMLRLMPHSTCERDDVPDWLKEIMPCPARPAGMRVKDSPSDPRYLKIFGQAVEKLGERFDNDETLDCVDVSLGGAWGEGSTAFPVEDMKALMDIYVRVFPNTKLLGQFANLTMLNHIGAQRKIGWRADAIGSRKHMNEIYPKCFPAVPADLWKTSPVSFESYWWISEWVRKGWDIDELIEMTLSWHMSTFNTKYLPIPYEIKDKIDYWLTKMGYRFVIREVEYPETVKVGETAQILLKVENVGVAPIYNKLPLKLRFKGEKSKEYVTDIDITKWLPGEYEEKISIDIPREFANGEYELQIAIGGGKYPIVHFANDIEDDEEFYSLAKIGIEN